MPRTMTPDDMITSVMVGAGWGPIITERMCVDIGNDLSDYLAWFFAGHNIAGVCATLVIGQTQPPVG